MTPNSSSDNEINVYCDWLTDNGFDSDEIRFENVEQNIWILEGNGAACGNIIATSGQYVGGGGIGFSAGIGDMVGGIRIGRIVGSRIN